MEILRILILGFFVLLPCIGIGTCFNKNLPKSCLGFKLAKVCMFILLIAGILAFAVISVPAIVIYVISGLAGLYLGATMHYLDEID